MESMKNLATGLVSDPNKSMHDGLCIDEKCANLESHVLQLLEIDTNSTGYIHCVHEKSEDWSGSSWISIFAVLICSLGSVHASLDLVTDCILAHL